ncbi:MAG: metal-dependent transcriptional regulator [Ruminococcaceae bacterium]|nr:metal-dependent transcriptional regulator [Oscillospiraceae bacterium]
MKIQQSAENYLETIYMLTNTKGSCRSVDIAKELGFSKPSVSVAMKNLRENGYIDVMGDGNIVLLEPGKKIATILYERHTILTKCLVAIGVPETIASEDACKIEHIISEETFEAIKKSLENHKGIIGE